MNPNSHNGASEHGDSTLRGLLQNIDENLLPEASYHDWKPSMWQMKVIADVLRNSLSGPAEQGPANLTIKALERMISSVIDDLAKTDAALLETTADLNGELRGLSAARAYLLSAIEKAAAVSEAGKGDGWIPVGERRPEPYDTVLLNCDGELRSTGYWNGSGERGKGWRVDADHPSDGAAWIVTHWRELPACPSATPEQG